MEVLVHVRKPLFRIALSVLARNLPQDGNTVTSIWGKAVSYRKFVALGFVVLSFGLVAESAQARALRVDGGAWDVNPFTTDSTQSIGFVFDFLGISGDTANISTNGSLTVAGGGETLELLPFFDTTQSGGGNSVRYEVGTTNANFNQVGIDAGFRVTWQVNDAAGALLNLFQLALWDFSNGSSGFEFDYDAITFGSDNTSNIGYQSSTGDSFDLPAALDGGLSFSQYQGVGAGLDGLTSTCPNAPNALACNNFYFSSMAFGPDANILPNIAGGYFRIVDGNDIDGNGIVDPAQGRYLFDGDGAVQVPEPTTLTLLAIGLAGLGMSMRRKKP